MSIKRQLKTLIINGVQIVVQGEAIMSSSLFQLDQFTQLKSVPQWHGDNLDMSLSSSNTSLNRGSHLAEVGAVVRLSHVYLGKNLTIDLGPQVVCDSAVVLHVIAAQDTPRFRLDYTNPAIRRTVMKIALCMT
ncbi:MAG: hypothetical protein WA672_11895 [Candidatus Angelobacter sp.]